MTWAGAGVSMYSSNTVIVKPRHNILLNPVMAYPYITYGSDLACQNRCIHPMCAIVSVIMGERFCVVVWSFLDGRCGAAGYFLYYWYVCNVKAMSFKSVLHGPTYLEPCLYVGQLRALVLLTFSGSQSSVAAGVVVIKNIWPLIHSY